MNRREFCSGKVPASHFIASLIRSATISRFEALSGGESSHESHRNRLSNPLLELFPGSVAVIFC